MNPYYKKILALSVFFAPTIAIAVSYDYSPLLQVTRPGGGSLYSSNILEYLKNIYSFGIAIVGGLAVIKIVYGGVKYMLTDIVTDKSDAKKEINAAVIGLLVALGSATLLYTINPKLLTLNFSMESTNAIVGDGKELVGAELYEAQDFFVGPPAPGFTGSVNGINWSDPSYKITENFTVGDVTKGDPSRIPQNESDMRTIVNMANKLEQVRAGWGSGIEFTSWYRPPAVNASVGGAEHSHHLTGNAVDIYPSNGDLAGFNKYIKQSWGEGGVGTYNSWVHFDLGAKRRW